MSGVVRPSVSYRDGKASVHVGDGVDSIALVAAIKAKGYGAQPAGGGDTAAAIGTRGGHRFHGAAQALRVAIIGSSGAPSSLPSAPPRTAPR